MDGQTKVVNIRLFPRSTLLEVLIKPNLEKCEECIWHTKFAYNRVIHATTKKSPFEVVYGFTRALDLYYQSHYMSM